MGKADEEMAEYTVELLQETDSAWRVSCDGAEVWLPKSKCEFPPSSAIGKTVEVGVPMWIAESRGIA